MARQLLNTLYVTTPGAFLHLENDTVKVKKDGQKILQVPLIHIGSIVTLGETMISPILIHHCADNGISMTLLDRNGKFKARLEGAVNGNILLRQSQYSQPEEKIIGLVRNIIAGKIKNSRQILLRGIRESNSIEDKEKLSNTANFLGKLLHTLSSLDNIDAIRGIEGEAARNYFGAVSYIVKPAYRNAFTMNGRTRRPPLDPMNALISFMYTLLTHDCRSALESVGLDPQYGFLHSLRPGRPSLALDLVEEFRSYLADRLALTLINRRQIKEKDFIIRPGGAVHMSDDTRKTIIVAYQERKKEEITHPLLETTIPLGLLPFTQARLLSRFLRDDMETYIPFLAK